QMCIRDRAARHVPPAVRTEPRPVMQRPPQDAVAYLASRPPWFPRVVATVLIALCVALSYFAVAVDFPDVVNAPFVLRPPSSKAAVTIPAGGVVTAVEQDTGARVDIGTVLYRVASPAAAEVLALGRQLEGLEAARERLGEVKRRALAVFDAQARALQPTITRHKKGLELKRRRVRMATQRREQAEKLHRDGRIAEVELDRDRESEITARLQQHTSESSLSGVKLEGLRIRAQRDLEAIEYDDRDHELQQQMEATRSTLAGYRGTLDLVEEGALVLRAPCTGTLAERLVSEPGDTVVSGQTLALVHCDEFLLGASVSLAQSRFPLIEAGLRVQLMYDALPYERWGARHGTVVRVSPMADQQGRFSADVSVDAQSISTSEGRVPLRPGMTGHARIIIGRRTLLDHALAPLRALRERWDATAQTSP
ncbi:MAG: HlyD family secretion protein, partial [Nannocystaceae bacterium]|nr:HlyD family secretion protein [Nannocystaceae bacterium]